MIKYAEQFNQVETLRQGRVNSRLARFLGEKINKAGHEFLSRIHQEIYESKPQWEKDLILAEQNALAANDATMEVVTVGDTVIVPAPELNDEYLTRLGLETTLPSN